MRRLLLLTALVAGASQVLEASLLRHCFHNLFVDVVLVAEVCRILRQRLARLGVPATLQLPLLYLGLLS